jgi:hypothetical protein
LTGAKREALNELGLFIKLMAFDIKMPPAWPGIVRLSK